MYTRHKPLIIWTVILNFLIVIGAGHGIAFLGLIEIFWLPSFYGTGTEDFSLSFVASYDHTLSIAAILSLTGQLVLLLSLAMKQHSSKVIITVTGLVFLWIGFFYLSHQAFTDSVSQLSFITGIPFLILSFVLLYKSAIKQWLNS